MTIYSTVLILDQQQRNINPNKKEKMKKPMTITAPIENGEVAYFSVIPSGTMEQFLEDVEWINSPQCVADLEKEGCWTIV